VLANIALVPPLELAAVYYILEVQVPLYKVQGVNLFAQLVMHVLLEQFLLHNVSLELIAPLVQQAAHNVPQAHIFLYLELQLLQHACHVLLEHLVLQLELHNVHSVIKEDIVLVLELHHVIHYVKQEHIIQYLAQLLNPHAHHVVLVLTVAHWEQNQLLHVLHVQLDKLVSPVLCSANHALLEHMELLHAILVYTALLVRLA
jgi:hypothetical protein